MCAAGARVGVAPLRGRRRRGGARGAMVPGWAGVGAVPGGAGDRWCRCRDAGGPAGRVHCTACFVATLDHGAGCSDRRVGDRNACLAPWASCGPAVFPPVSRPFSSFLSFCSLPFSVLLSSLPLLRSCFSPAPPPTQPLLQPPRAPQTTSPAHRLHFPPLASAPGPPRQGC